MRGNERTGLALAVGAAVAFGTLAVVGKLAYRAGAEPFSLLALRFTVAAAILVAWHRMRGGRAHVEPRRKLRLLLLGALGYGVEASLYFLALQRARAGVVGLIFYSFPLWTNVIGFATGIERFRVRVAGALVLGSVGVASIFSVSGTSLAGPLLALGAAFVVAVYFIGAQLLSRGVPPSTAATYTSAGAAISTGIATLVTRQSLPAEAVGHGIVLGALTAIAFLLMYAAIARIGSSRASIASMTEPVTTVILAAIILGEAVTLRIAVGAALVISALPILATGGRREAAVPAADTI